MNRRVNAIGGVLVVGMVLVSGGCKSRPPGYAASAASAITPERGRPAAGPGTSASAAGQGPERDTNIEQRLQEYEAAAIRRNAESRPCLGAAALYEGSITVARKDYVHTSEQQDEAPIPKLDKVAVRAPEVRFTLDYPFDKPFTGTVGAPVTLRRIIDAVRAGYRTMYDGATEKEIPGMMNRDVRGRYGQSFHVIDDLVIERIELCDGARLEITIGS